MRRAQCGPLAGTRRRVVLGDWEGLPGAAGGGSSPDLGREVRRRVLAYGLAHCLTPAQREAVELCCGRGMTGVQAAEVVGVHPSTMNRRLNRALEKLRALA